MANTKQKQAAEAANRRPGKSRFSIPRKEAPPIDGSYLERLFADYEKQSQAIEQEGADAVEAAESPSPVAEPPKETITATTLTGPPDAVQESEPPPVPSTDAHPTPTVEPFLTVNDETAVIPAHIPKERRKNKVTTTADRGAPRLPRLPKFADNDAVLLERLKKKHRLGKGEINVLGAMIRLCRESGADYCYVKIHQLMAASDLKERQTQVVLRNLRELELIEKLADYSNIDRLGTKYRVNLDSF